jgi:ABC-type branched-subunit amino acid transport system substrate-binding protein
MRPGRSTSFSARRRSATATFVIAALAGCGDGTAATTPGVSGDTITVGVIASQSDAVAVIGVPMTAGVQTYFDALNARGGIGGRYKVRVLVEDHTYANPSTSAQKYQKVKGDVAMFATVIGTDHINMLIPLLAEDSMMVVPASFDAEWVREPNVLPWAPPYQIWAMNGLSYFRSLPGNAAKHVCTMALATGYGEAGLEGARHGAEQEGYTIAATASFKQDDQDFVAPITQLRNARCDAVLLVSLPGTTGRVIGTAAQAGFTPQWLILSPGWLGAFVESPLRDYLSRHAWVLFDGPEWGDTTVTAMRELLVARERFRADQKPDLYFAAGWTAAIATERLLAKAVELGDLSRGGIMRASDALGTVSFEGAASDYTYGPAAERVPPRTTSIYRVDRSNPIGLKALQLDFRSPAADRYVFAKKAR